MGKQPASASAGRESRWDFLKAFFRDRKTVGAVAPTSRGVARRIARLAGVRSARLVAELGAGTGAITRELLAAMPAEAHLWAFEIYPPFVQQLKANLTDPRLSVLVESAEAIGDLRVRESLPPFHAIVSTLPFSLMGPAQTKRVLRAVAEALEPNGVFVALQYHPLYLAPLLRQQFQVVEREVHLWNIPPALLLRARAPRSGG